MKAVGSCGNLRRLNISGDSHLGDEAIHNLISGMIYSLDLSIINYFRAETTR